MSGETISENSYDAMLSSVQAFHEKHDFKNTGGEELSYRVALMAEELGEISSCVTKGKSKESLAEETADLMILLIGTAIISITAYLFGGMATEDLSFFRTRLELIFKCMNGFIC